MNYVIDRSRVKKKTLLEMGKTGTVQIKIKINEIMLLVSGTEIFRFY